MEQDVARQFRIFYSGLCHLNIIFANFFLLYICHISENIPRRRLVYLHKHCMYCRSLLYLFNVTLYTCTNFESKLETDVTVSKGLISIVRPSVYCEIWL